MGVKYLWDTNAVIYYLQKHFSDSGQELMNGIINDFQPVISAITEIELLSWKTAKENDVNVLSSFIGDSLIIELEPKIKIKTVEIRKLYGDKLPDAIIAATALVMDLTLITNDRRGFHKISPLKLLRIVD